MSEQAKSKLPKVWVLITKKTRVPSFVALQREACVRYSAPHEEPRQYAPVQPPRRCVWRRDSGEVWFSPCHGTVLSAPEKFCPRCGGKIVRKS